MSAIAFTTPRPSGTSALRDLTSATSYGENTQDFRQRHHDAAQLGSAWSPIIEQTTGVERITQELRLASHENEKSTGWSAPTTTTKTA